MNLKKQTVVALSMIALAACKPRSSDSDLNERRQKGIEGVTSMFADGYVMFSTPKADYNFELSAVDKATAKVLEESHAKRKRVIVDLPASVLKYETKAALNVRPDCGEMPLTYEELLSAANESQDIVQFQKKLPKTSLQTFTFIHKSQSPLKNEVNEKSPRVLRMSADGKLVVAFSCNKKGPHYNHAEVMRFDDETKEFKFSEISFKAAAGKKVRENPSECQQCHVPSLRDVDPRPNWQMYFTWDGVYGIHDDQLGGTLPVELNGEINPVYRLSMPRQKFEPRPAELKGEVQSYLKFRQSVADNDCFEALPWVEGNVPGYEYYPYSMTFKSANYHLRPNLKVTEGLSHLMGQRMARKFLERPKFKPFRFDMAMEALECPQDVASLDRDIKKIVPSFKLPPTKIVNGTDLYQTILAYFDPRLKQSGSPRLYALGKALGFSDADWTMNFNQPANPVYNTGLSPDNNIPLVADVSIMRLTQSALLDELSKELPKLKKTYKKTRGEAQNFGNLFQCVDDLGGQVYAVNRDEACKLLSEAKAKSRKADLEFAKQSYSGRKRAGLDTNVAYTRTIKQNPQDIDKGLVKDGKEIAQNVCGACHDGSNSVDKLRFFQDEGLLARKLGQRSGNVDFIAKMFARIDDEASPMPPKDYDTMNDQDKDALAEYLNALYLRP